jgi:hypothetical protein
MRSLLLLSWCLGAVSNAAAVTPSSPSSFKVDLSSGVPHMLDLIQKTILPTTEDPAAVDSYNLTQTTGLPLTTLASLQNEWLTGFNWTTEEDAMNKYISQTVSLRMSTNLG